MAGSATAPFFISGDNLSPDGTEVGYPDVSMYGNCKAVIGWSQDDGTEDYQVFKAERR